MKTKEFTELKSKKKIELFKLVNAKKLELTKITSRIYAGREKNVKKGRNLRRDIAQIMSLTKEAK